MGNGEWVIAEVYSFTVESLHPGFPCLWLYS